MSLRILVVGRDVHAREGLRSILLTDGHEVDVAQDIWEGFARVAAHAFDLLLLDDDVRLGGHAAMIVADLLAFARLQHPATCGIVISSFVDGVPRYRREDGVLVRGGQSAHTSAMHKSETVDYGIMLAGERMLVLDTGTLVMKPGDVVVQLGNWHLWSSERSDVTMAFVMMGAKYEG